MPLVISVLDSESPNRPTKIIAIHREGLWCVRRQGLNNPDAGYAVQIQVNRHRCLLRCTRAVPRLYKPAAGNLRP